MQNRRQSSSAEEEQVGTGRVSRGCAGSGAHKKTKTIRKLKKSTNDLEFLEMTMLMEQLIRKVNRTFSVCGHLLGEAEDSQPSTEEMQGKQTKEGGTQKMVKISDCCETEAQTKSHLADILKPKGRTNMVVSLLS